MCLLRLGAFILLVTATVPFSQSALAADANGIAVATADGLQEQPAIIADGAGGAIVVWIDRRNIRSDIYAQRLNAQGVPQWISNGVPVCQAVALKSAPTLVSDGAGGAIIAWQDARNATFDTFDIYAQRVSASGVQLWSPGGNPVCRAAHDQDVPCIATDARGGAIIGWYDGRRGLADVFDIYAQRLSSSGVPLWTPDGVAVCAAGGADYLPSIVPDDLGGAILVWDDGRNGSTDQDVYAQRVDSTGTPHWIPNGVAVCSHAGYQGGSVAVQDGVSGVIAAWVDVRSSSLDIFAQRLGADGATKWAADGVALCNDASDQTSPAITTDDSGGAIVAWEDRRDGHGVGVIYAQRVVASGVPQWSTNGVPLSVGVSGQRYEAIAGDHAGGAIIAWQDDRSGIDWDLYAQHVSGAGMTQWDPGAAPLCTAPGGQYFFGSLDYRTHNMAEDGAGGAYFTWTDGRADANNPDIYMQHMSSAGAALAVPVAGTHNDVAVASPNPFRSQITMAFSLTASNSVHLEVFDLAGRSVLLSPAALLNAGPHTWAWDGRGDDGVTRSPGVYFMCLRSAGFSIWDRVVRLK